MNEQTITESVNGIKIKAVFNSNGVVNFYEQSGSRNAGRANYNTHTGEWMPCSHEFGGRFKATLKAVFKL